MNIVKQSVELLWHTPGMEYQIEVAGRTCYKSEDKINNESSGKFAEQMRKRGHHAMLEHAVASFRIITDRGISHEIVRHRLASYAQESTRYCNYSGDKFGKECTFIQPLGIYGFVLSQWLQACQESENRYFRMIELGASPQIARSVLPNSLKTEIVMTANLREWRHFIKLRSSKAAHPQIIPIAMDIRAALMREAPSVFADLLEDQP